MNRANLLRIGVPAILLAIMLFEIASSISRQSLTWDEGDHLFAGYMSLKADDNSLNPEHPPMAKMVAALPLLPLALKIAPHQPERYFKDDAYLRGRELIYATARKMAVATPPTPSSFAPAWRSPSSPLRSPCLSSSPGGRCSRSKREPSR